MSGEPQSACPDYVDSGERITSGSLESSCLTRDAPIYPLLSRLTVMPSTKVPQQSVAPAPIVSDDDMARARSFAARGHCLFAIRVGTPAVRNDTNEA